MRLDFNEIKSIIQRRLYLGSNAQLALDEICGSTSATENSHYK